MDDYNDNTGNKAVTDPTRAIGLADYGFDENIAVEFAAAERAFAAASDGRLEAARVVETGRGSCRVVLSRNGGGVEEISASPAGSLLHASVSSSLLPAVGDWVALYREGISGSARIMTVLPRRSMFARKSPGDVEHDRIEAQVIAANVDTVFITAAAGRDWKARRVERYLALAYESGASPVLVVTKIDLSEDQAALEAEAERTAPFIPKVFVCALDGRGMDRLREYLPPRRTAVLLGSSGAGKSTLLNALAGRTLAATGEIRADDQRGRHTTTSRQLYRLDSGALIIDTPGLRELQLLVEAEAIDAAFPEIERAAEDCRFRDCSHETEPGCAVRAAVESGLIERSRYESWRKLVKESAFLRTKTDHAAKEAERRRWKSIEMSKRALRNRSSRGY